MWWVICGAVVVTLNWEHSSLTSLTSHNRATPAPENPQIPCKPTNPMQTRKSHDITRPATSPSRFEVGLVSHLVVLYYSDGHPKSAENCIQPSNLDSISCCDHHTPKCTAYSDTPTAHVRRFSEMIDVARDGGWRVWYSFSSYFLYSLDMISSLVKIIKVWSASIGAIWLLGGRFTLFKDIMTCHHITCRQIIKVWSASIGAIWFLGGRFALFKDIITCHHITSHQIIRVWSASIRAIWLVGVPIAVPSQKYPFFYPHSNGLRKTHRRRQSFTCKNTATYHAC